MIINIIKIFFPTAVAFFVGIGITPFITNKLYKYKAWKKQAGKIDSLGNTAETFNKLHQNKEVGTPRLGGIIIWASTLITAVGFWIVSKFFPDAFSKFDFISRNQTWIPLVTLLVGAFVGAIDDFLEIKRGNGGLPLWQRLLTVTVVGILAGFWFYEKLDVVSVGLPFGGEIFVGALIIPIVALVMLFIYSGGVIDGIDGLSGGVFAVIFVAYAGIAFSLNQINLAALSAVIGGSILAFLWFNIPPARFYMTETGSMALTMALTIIAFMTDTIGGGYGLICLPIVAFPLVITTISDIIQIASKKIRGKKVFLVAPLHHHFEALGWSREKITMRYWILSVIFGIIGLCFALIR